MILFILLDQIQTIWSFLYSSELTDTNEDNLLISYKLVL